jgi:hypothetical protein
MRTGRQEHNRITGQVFAEAVAALRNAPALLGHNEDDPEFAVDSRAPAATQIQPARGIGHEFGVEIRISEDLLNALFDPYS